MQRQWCLTLCIGVLLAGGSLPTHASASKTEGVIHPEHRFAWSENIGWINFNVDGGEVRVTDTGLSGKAWGENIGWIVLDEVTNDGKGKLSGMAWAENVGWIDFSPPGGGVTINERGEFGGWAWGENIGWISFTCDTTPGSCEQLAEYGVKTGWRPQRAPRFNFFSHIFLPTSVTKAVGGFSPVFAPIGSRVTFEEGAVAVMPLGSELDVVDEDMLNMETALAKRSSIAPAPRYAANLSPWSEGGRGLVAAWRGLLRGAERLSTLVSGDSDSSSSASSVDGVWRYKEVAIALADQQGRPLVGAELKLFSELREAVTDESGRAVFRDVPSGSHRLVVAFEEYYGEQEIVLVGEHERVEIRVTPELTGGVNPLWAVVVTLICAGLAGGAVAARRKTKIGVM